MDDFNFDMDNFLKVLSSAYSLNIMPDSYEFGLDLSKYLTTSIDPKLYQTIRVDSSETMSSKKEETIYLHPDENGIVHISDPLPLVEQPKKKKIYRPFQKISHE